MEAAPFILVIGCLTMVLWLAGISIYCLPLLRHGYWPWRPRGTDEDEAVVGQPATVETARVLRGWPVTPLPREPLAFSALSIAGPGRRPSVSIHRKNVEAVICVKWHPQGNFLLFQSKDSRYRNVAIAPLEFDAGLQLLEQLGWPTSEQRR